MHSHTTFYGVFESWIREGYLTKALYACDISEVEENADVSSYEKSIVLHQMKHHLKIGFSFEHHSAMLLRPQAIKKL